MDTDNQKPEVTPENVADVYAEIAAEVFDESDSPDSSDAWTRDLPASEDDQKAEGNDETAGEPELQTTEPDSSASSDEETSGDDQGEDPPQTVENQLQQLTQQISNVETLLGNRLKQAEHRIGSIQNTLHNEAQAAKLAAAQTTSGPSQAQIAEAFKDSEDWQSLKDEYPEWAEIMDGFTNVLSTIKTGTNENPIDFDKLRTEIRDELKEGVQGQLSEDQMASEMLAVDVAMKGKKWRQDIGTPEFENYLNSLDPEISQGIRTTKSSAVFIQAMNGFNAYQQGQNGQGGGNSTDQADLIAQQREKRLASSTTPEVRKKKPTKPKSEQDMSPEEVRAAVSAEVWNE